MMKKVKIAVHVLRILMILLCIMSASFIVYNSIQTGETSTQRSHKAVDTVQEVAKVIAPDSKIATATGEEYEQLHSDIRQLAHFSEFAVFGFSAFGCCLSFTQKKKMLVYPSLFVVLFSVLDEYLQTFTAGRAGQAIDVLMDVMGALSGGMFALIMASILIFLYKKKEKGHGAREFGDSLN